jgi:predicted dehydrogenase
MGLTLAIVGLKGHQYVVLDALPAMPEVELIAVADDDPNAISRLQDLRGATPNTRAYHTLWDLLANHTPDIVLEAGTDRDRAGVIIACAERGIHLIAEKPLANHPKALERVVDAVTRSGVTLTMLLTMRCEPFYVALREAVAAGAVGAIAQAGAQKSYRLGERPAWQKSCETFSGIIPFIGIHAIDLIRWCSGREFTEVMAYCANSGHPEMGDLEDNGCIIGRLDNGASAAIHLDYCRPAAAPTHGDDRLRIAGSRGVIESMHERVTLITNDEGPRDLPIPAPIDFFADFVDALAARRQPYIPFADCVRVTEIALRARQSAETGKPCSV